MATANKRYIEKLVKALKKGAIPNSYENLGTYSGGHKTKHKFIFEITEEVDGVETVRNVSYETGFDGTPGGTRRPKEGSQSPTRVAW
jgi:hypothetical protein